AESTRDLAFLRVTDSEPPGIYSLSLHDALPIFVHEVASQRAHPAEDLRRIRSVPIGARERKLTAVRVDGFPAVSRVTVGELVRRSEEHTSELQSRFDLVCRLLLEKKKLDAVM